MHETDLGPLRICYSCAAWSSCGSPNVGAEDVSDSVAWLCVFFLLLGCFVQPYRRGGAKSYHNLICHGWLISVGGLHFSEDKERRSGWEAGKEEGLGGEEGRETEVEMEN